MKDPGAGFGGFVIALPPGSGFLNSELQIRPRILTTFIKDLKEVKNKVQYFIIF
jgi:hypothetical protein